MYANSSKAYSSCQWSGAGSRTCNERLTILLGNVNCVLRLFKTRPCDHHLLAAHAECSFDNFVQIVFMCLLAMVDSSEDRIREIDANLRESAGSCIPLHQTDIGVSQLLRSCHASSR